MLGERRDTIFAPESTTSLSQTSCPGKGIDHLSHNQANLRIQLFPLPSFIAWLMGLVIPEDSYLSKSPKLYTNLRPIRIRKVQIMVTFCSSEAFRRRNGPM